MKPSIALSNPGEQCLTFYWEEHPEYYLGYRFVEGQPTVSDQTASYHQPRSADSQELPTGATPATDHPSTPGWKEDWLGSYQEQDAHAPVQLSFQLYQDGSAQAVSSEQDGGLVRELLVQPFSQGARLQLKLTSQADIQGSFLLQQCLRFTGMYNAGWRRLVALTPFLSELDMQAMGNPNGTLTYARRKDEWLSFPVQHTVYPTRSDLPPLMESSTEPVDHGLIVRETVNRRLAPPEYWAWVAPQAAWEQIACGMYWERTAFVSNRHPADCVHAYIDFGPLAAGESRTLHGAVYFIEGSKDDLLELWKRDFK